jgi:cytidine deaminase
MPRPPTSDELALWEQARAARERAYAPYSRFPVGAALRLADGRVVLGANVENASYGMTICAERTAIVQAVVQGERAFDAIAVACPDNVRTGSPCGACRQVLTEFGPAMTVIYRRDGELVAEPASELLPASFELDPEA